VILAVAFSVGAVLTAVVIAGVFLYRRKVNRKKNTTRYAHYLTIMICVCLRGSLISAL
jgi:multisubunit Na+/H+ antiporter MnhB subunit